jgi:YVTN family beta-propeller protein
LAALQAREEKAEKLPRRAKTTNRPQRDMWRLLCLMLKHSIVMAAVSALPLWSPAAAPRLVERPALLVLDKSDNDMAVIDLKSRAITARIPVGAAPHEVVTSEDGAWAFVANYGDGPNPGHTISVIDLQNLREVRKVDTAPLYRPHGLDHDAHGGRVA